jgi:hypothetical protein
VTELWRSTAKVSMRDEEGHQKSRLLSLSLRISDESMKSAENQQGIAAPTLRQLRGLGKELWEEIDAAEYVERERSAWGS